MKHDTKTKAKFLRLVRCIRGLHDSQAVSPELVAVGVLQSLWNVTVSSAPQGDIGKLDDEIICEMIGWQADPKALIEILVSTGWLDRCDNHRLVVHNWDQHAPRFIKANLKRHNKQLAVASSLEQPTTIACSKEPTQGKVQHNLTKHNQTEGTSTDVASDSLKVVSGKSFTRFCECWNKTHPSIKADPESVPLIKAWNNSRRISELREVLDHRIADLQAAISSQPWLSDQPWFRPAWLFKRERNGTALNAQKILDKQYTQSNGSRNGNSTRTAATGPGQRYDPAEPTQTTF